MSILKIALLQIAPCKNLNENLEKGIACCKEAKEKGADIALFPEMWSNEYRIYDIHPYFWHTCKAASYGYWNYSA